MSLLFNKLNHLEKALQLEDRELDMKRRIAKKKATVEKEQGQAVSKNASMTATEKLLQKEEKARRDLILNMKNNSSGSLTPIMKVLENVEGNIFLNFYINGREITFQELIEFIILLRTMKEKNMKFNLNFFLKGNNFPLCNCSVFFFFVKILGV